MISNLEKIHSFKTKAFGEFADYVLPYFRRNEASLPDWLNAPFNTEKWLAAIEFLYAPEYRQKARALFEIAEYERTIPVKTQRTNCCMSGIWVLVGIAACMFAFDVLTFLWCF